LAPVASASGPGRASAELPDPATHHPGLGRAGPACAGRNRGGFMTDPSLHPPIGADIPPGHTEAVPKPVLRRAIAASAMGNATEWFDYGIYAYGVVYISAALFPGDTAEATLFALATFAISFLVRPLGGLFWGPLGDRYGRK